jgi:hypothetical protein
MSASPAYETASSEQRITSGDFPVALQRIASLVDQRTIVAFGLPFLLYILTLAPTIYNLDSAELTTAAATGGLVRSTGYPLYLLIGRFWSRIPVGDVGYRMNLFSAVCGALTVALAERILRRLRVGPWAIIGALGLLACSTYFWALSLIAEVYTMHTALMAGLILSLLHWGENPQPRRLALVGLVLGLSLSHHAATVLLVPGCVWYVVTVAPRRAIKPRSLLPALAALLLGLSVYLYLPICYAADPAFNYVGHYNARGDFVPVNLQTVKGLWWLISGRPFASNMFGYEGIELWREVKQFGVHLWQTFLGVGIGPGLLGMVVLWRRNWQLGGMLLLMFVSNAGFYIDYRVADKVTMFLPAYLIWALWLGVGYQWLLQWVTDVDDAAIRHLSALSLYAIVIGVVLFSLSWNWPLANLSDDWSACERGEEILEEVEPNALIFGWWDTVPVVEYLQLVEGERPDVKAINRFLITADNIRSLIKQDIVRRPIYIDSVPSSLPRFVEAKAVDPLYRLQLKDLDSTPRFP